MYLLLLGFGVVAGVTTVLFGFGGGFVVVPVLYSVLLAVHGAHSAIGQAAMHIAVATSTCVMIFGATLATWRHHRAGTLEWGHVRHLMGYIALGAILGAFGATKFGGAWLHWAFIGYLGLTILDSTLRSGFFQERSSRIRPMGKLETRSIGVVIGAIAAFLGVGGSVMTVPLMRRRGASMTAATAMASPLSLPMAVAGTLTYITLARRGTTAFGPWYAGYIDFGACAVLVAGAWLGIRLASPWIGRISDQIHARTYIFLLCLVLIVMLLM